ncbi:MAG: SipW-dependent-type signal peptide-containing protein [bacterium]|nr:SipW-dependent-type signal peptide-containing protein [bacterium]
MKTRKLRKFLMLLASALLLVSVTVGATVAYLTAEDTVVNTFTVGKVGLTLDETNVDKKDAAGNDNPDVARDKANKYHLLPGQSYDKDPIVHVTANSENSFVFVKVVNGLKAIEAASVVGGYQNVEAQILANGWTKLDGVDNVYYRSYTKSETVTDYPVFTKVQLKGEGLVNGTPGKDEISIDAYANANITVTAYAIQAAGFNGDANAAWTAGAWN